MIKAVLFDLDGTLVNSLKDLAVSANYSLREMGFPEHDLEKYYYFIGDGIPKLIWKILPDNNKDEQTHSKCLKIFMDYYGNHFSDFTYVYDGIKSILDYLRSSDIKIAVISNKADQFTKVVVDKFLPDYFDVIVGLKGKFSPKPDPSLTLYVINKLQVKKEECILVGDSGMDMAVTVNAGIKGIGALWGFRTEQELIENGAAYIAEKPEKIIDAIRDLNNE